LPGEELSVKVMAKQRLDNRSLEAAMTTGVLSVQIQLGAIGSLKDKRRIVRSVIERLKSRFNVSASEISAQDSKLLAVIGIAVVANDGDFVQRQLDTIIDFIRRDGRFFVGRIEREIFHSDADLPRI